MPSESHEPVRLSTRVRPKDPRAGPSREQSPSFLFVVNKLEMVCAGHLNPDYWGNKVPPEAKGGFAAEDESVVMRYQDGRVTTAPEYRWSREVWRQEGTIRRAQNSNKIERYKERAIFSSSPFLPIIISKVDPTAHDVGSVPGNNCDYRWRLLHFRRSEQHAGVSLVNHESSGAEYVVGRNPSWMPSLVPSVFANTCSRSRDSHGLGGELPILLGLMAFWEHPSIPHKERMAKTFIGDNAHWRDYQWTAETEPRGYPRCGDEPRGFLVHVGLDDQNPASTSEALKRLEDSALVTG